MAAADLSRATFIERSAGRDLRAGPALIVGQTVARDKQAIRRVQSLKRTPDDLPVERHSPPSLAENALPPGKW